MPDVRIRPARDEDARSIAEIHVRAWHWAYRDLLPPAVLDRLLVDRRAAYWQQSGWRRPRRGASSGWRSSRTARSGGPDGTFARSRCYLMTQAMAP